MRQGDGAAHGPPGTLTDEGRGLRADGALVPGAPELGSKGRGRDAEVYVQAASGPKEVKWYDTDHSFNEEARRDREEWLKAACTP